MKEKNNQEETYFLGKAQETRYTKSHIYKKVFGIAACVIAIIGITIVLMFKPQSVSQPHVLKTIAVLPEGGQMPIQRRLPKFGFKNINRVEYKAINLDVLQRLADVKKLTKIDVQTLIDGGFLSGNQLVKILGNGALTAKVDVEAHAFSKSAEAAIEAIGGTVTKLK